MKVYQLVIGNPFNMGEYVRPKVFSKASDAILEGYSFMESLEADVPNYVIWEKLKTPFEMSRSVLIAKGYVESLYYPIYLAIRICNTDNAVKFVRPNPRFQISSEDRKRATALGKKIESGGYKMYKVVS